MNSFFFSANVLHFTPARYGAWRLWAAPLAVLIFLGSVLARQVEGTDVFVVRPAAWAPALKSWKAYREQQGYSVTELDAEGGQEAIRARIAQLAAGEDSPLRFVLLAGDVRTAAGELLPTFYHRSTAMSQFGGEPSIATDNPYADLDGDHVPELAIGRIPADSAEQLEAVLARVIAYEQQGDYSSWRRDVHVVAGVGGFGALADSMIEMTTRRFLADRIPGWSELSMTQASLQSHYCPDPFRFGQTCVGRLNQGGLLWVYIGHGHVQTLDYLQVAQEALPILTADQLDTVDSGDRPPIAIFLACYTGAFDAAEDCLAERMMLQPGGPIAALAASRVSGPYGLAMLSDGLLTSCFDVPEATLGEVVLKAKQRMLPRGEQLAAVTASGDARLQMIDAIAGALTPDGYDLEAERREHVWQMNLLGDPLLRLNHPGVVELRLPDHGIPGQALAVRGLSGFDGQLTLELAYRRDQVRRELNTFADFRTGQGREHMQQRYTSANQRVIAQQDVLVRGGAFETELVIPSDLPRGRYAVRAFLEGEGGWEVGYHELNVRPPR